jgi:hypothetical protein
MRRYGSGRKLLCKIGRSDLIKQFPEFFADSPTQQRIETTLCQLPERFSVVDALSRPLQSGQCGAWGIFIVLSAFNEAIANKWLQRMAKRRQIHDHVPRQFALGRNIKARYRAK